MSGNARAVILGLVPRIYVHLEIQDVSATWTKAADPRDKPEDDGIKVASNLLPRPRKAAVVAGAGRFRAARDDGWEMAEVSPGTA